MDDINKFFADSCGIKISHSRYFSYPDFKSFRHEYKDGTYAKYIQDGNIDMEWSIDDPRCREVIREKFKIRTVWNESDNVWKAYTFTPFAEPNGRTIAEAEIACLKAIYENRNEL